MAERCSRAEECQEEADSIEDRGHEIIEQQTQNDVYYSRFTRFCKQTEAWKEHLTFFKVKIISVFVCSLLITALCIYAFFEEEIPFMIHTVVAILIAATFSFYWIMIPEGPPFLAKEDGSIIKSDYLSFIP